MIKHKKYRNFHVLKWVIIGAIPLFSIACKTNHLAKIEPQNYSIEVEDEIQTNTDLEKLLAPYRNQLNEEMDVVIGHCSLAMEKASPESSLGNWLADALLSKAEQYSGQSIDFAIQNYGGIRIPSLPAGAITKRNIFELMPFDNRLVYLELETVTIHKLIQHMASSDGWPVSKTLCYEINNGKAQNILINNSPLEEKRVYIVAMPDFIANGGDNCFFLKDKPQYDTGILLRDALIEFISDKQKANLKIQAKLDGRVKMIKN